MLPTAGAQRGWLRKMAEVDGFDGLKKWILVRANGTSQGEMNGKEKLNSKAEWRLDLICRKCLFGHICRKRTMKGTGTHGRIFFQGSHKFFFFFSIRCFNVHIGGVVLISQRCKLVPLYYNSAYGRDVTLQRKERAQH